MDSGDGIGEQDNVVRTGVAPEGFYKHLVIFSADRRTPVPPGDGIGRLETVPVFPPDTGSSWESTSGSREPGHVRVPPVQSADMFDRRGAEHHPLASWQMSYLFCRLYLFHAKRFSRMCSFRLDYSSLRD